MPVPAEQQVGGKQCCLELRVGWVDHGGVDAGGEREGQERAVDERARRQAEGDVAQAERDVDLRERRTHAPHDLERHARSLGVGGDGHDQRIDVDAIVVDAGAARGCNETLDDLHAAIFSGRDAMLVHRQRDHAAAVRGNEGQDLVEALVLAADRIDQWGVLDLLERRRQGLGVGAVEAQRQVRRGLHGLHQPDQVLGLPLWGCARVHVEPMRPGVRLPARQSGDEGAVPAGDGGRDLLARAVDLLTDDLHAPSRGGGFGNHMAVAKRRLKPGNVVNST